MMPRDFVPEDLLMFVNTLKSFARLPRQDQRLLIRAFCLAGFVRLVILIVPFRRLSPFLGSHMGESPREEDDARLAYAWRVGQTVETVSRYTPWKSKCLVQAVVAKILLRRLGIANTLYMGVARDEGEGLVAHAWLRCGETILTGGQGRERFTVVSTFADGAHS